MSKECILAVELESEGGYRFWSRPMPESEVDEYIRYNTEELSYFLSDVDHSTKSECDCECMKM